ncbi:hypothetical protein HDU81_011133 [Chytriomyces hyalinus]|nr:hypothetical protein HDU81_011133 [Chytriomyces hyalinus]
MRGELQKPQQEFHEDLQRIRLNWINPILREFNALPDQVQDGNESDDGTYVAPATRSHLPSPTQSPERAPRNPQVQLSPTSSTSSDSGTAEPTRMEAVIPQHLTANHVNDIDQFQDVKSLLKKYGPLVSKKYTTIRQEFSDSYDTPESVERRRYQGTDVAEMKMRLTEQIRQSLYYVAAMTNKTNGYHLFIGEKLIQLLDEFRKNSKPKAEQFADFLEHLNSEFRLKRTSFYAYRNFAEFVCKYQRFSSAPMYFTTIVKNIKKFQAWFDSSECKQLADTDVLSAAFWKDTPAELHTCDTTFAFDIDDEGLLADVDLEDLNED